MHKKLKKQKKKRRILEKVLQEKLKQDIYIIACETCKECIKFYNCSFYLKSKRRCNEWERKC